QNASSLVSKLEKLTTPWIHKPSPIQPKCDITSRKTRKAYDTWDSQAVSDPSTNQAQRCLTCQIGRDGVLSTWYGRKRTHMLNCCTQYKRIAHRDSQAVSDPSTNQAQRCLTCQIGRDGVLSTWYGPYDTWDSQAVSDPSTNQAQRCLTCQIGRDGVLSTWYGRKRNYMLNCCTQSNCPPGVNEKTW
uniref:Zf-3CxxC domain-containing protein n=1 Tax=Angiostrongylus cantonensis TaxID=6313 RepID=A0A0K0DM32_ANGCA